jgi:hypothetical protein
LKATRPVLFAATETVREIERARAVVALIGSYDGSGNFGDIAQLGAALDLVARLGPGVVALPVLERQYLADHRQLSQGSDTLAQPALFFDPETELEDDLVPVATPAELAFGAAYLYGGGYLNRLWGERKLAMLAAAEALLAAGQPAATCRLSSGLQVEPAWLASGEAAVLGDFDLLGARDGDSRQALAKLAPTTPVSATGDDAIGLLLHLRPAAGTAIDGRVRLNLHLATHDWVSERPQAILGFYAGFVAELGRLANRPVVAQPLIAYLDDRVDERAGAARVCEFCSALGIEVAEPLVLRPASLAEKAPELSKASLTLSCSYHVALTSLMLEVPAVLIADNPYYEQKAAGLRADFGLPPAFATAATADPAACAGEIADLLFDPDRERKLRDGLAAAAERGRRRRSEGEGDLLARLGAGAVAALASRAEDLAERLRLRSAEPAELQARLSALQTEREDLQRRVEVSSPLEAELRSQQAEAREAAAQEALAAVLRSRSWRLTAPLRRLAAPLRRLRRR